MDPGLSPPFHACGALIEHDFDLFVTSVHMYSRDRTRIWNTQRSTERSNEIGFVLLPDLKVLLLQ
jgi:hypothetical protein